MYNIYLELLAEYMFHVLGEGIDCMESIHKHICFTTLDLCNDPLPLLTRIVNYVTLVTHFRPGVEF